jgi:TP901 family phage tail tape measure protein
LSQERSIKVTFRTNVADFKQQLKSASTSLEDLAAKGDKTGKVAQTQLGRLAQSAQLQKEAWATVSTGLAAYGAAATALVAVAVKKFADFDEAMSGVQADTQESAANMELLRAAAIQAGADTAYSATEAAGAIDALAKAGISTTDILSGGLAGSLSLAAAGGLEVSDAAEIAATALTQFKLSGQDVNHVADLLAAGAGKAQGDVSDLSMALKQSGLVASQTGLSIEETTGALSAFASAGLLGSDAGTSFKSMLQRLTPQSKEAQTLMDELGISAYDAQGNFVGLAAFAGNLQDSLRGLTTEQRNSAMATIFGSDAVRAASVLYDQGADGIQEWIDKVDDSGYASRVAAQKMDNLKGDIEKLSGSLETAFIKAGSGANDMLRQLVQWADSAVDSFSRLPAPAHQGVIGLVALTGAAAGIVGIGMKVFTSLADMRTAMDSLNLSGGKLESRLKTTAKVLGKLTTAATAYGIALNVLDNDWQSSAEGVEQFNNQLATTGKIDISKAFAGVNDGYWGRQAIDVDNFSEALRSAADPGFWEQVDNSITSFFGSVDTASLKSQQQFKAIGESLSELASTDLASAQSAFTELWEAAGGDEASGAKLLEVMPAYKTSLTELATELGLAADDTTLLQLANGDLETGLDGTSSAADGTSSAIGSVTDAAQDATDAMDEYVQSLNDAAGVQLDLSDAQMQWEAAIDSATDALTENGQTLDITTEAGRNNRAALDDMASSAWDLVTSLYEVDGASADLEGTMQTARNAFIQTAIQMGMTQAEAEELADKYGLIPSNVRTTVEASDNASGTIAWIKQQLIELPNHKTITVETRQIGRVGVGMAASTYAVGGAVSGLGTATSDSILARLSNGEHVLTASDVQKIGGQSAVYRLRAAIQAGMVRFADGGAVGGSSLVSPKVMVSTSPAIYVQNPFTGKYLLAQVDQRAENIAVDVVNAR